MSYGFNGIFVINQSIYRLNDKYFQKFWIFSVIRGEFREKNIQALAKI